jgi:hypothetical protein
MKKIRLFGVALALVGASAVAAMADDDEKLTMDQVPEKVQAAIKKHVKDGRVEDIHRETKQDKVYYEVDYENAKGQDYELVLTEDGHVIGNRKEY